MKHAFKALLLVSLLSGLGIAHADDTTSTSTSNSNSTSTGSSTGTNTNTINFPGAPANNSVEYKGSYTVKAAPALYAPPLVTTMTDTCMGSSSFGASISGFGLSAGTTWTDKSCVRRLDAREFRAMGLNDVAIALLCQTPDNRAAVEATGRSCPGTVRSTVVTEAAQASATPSTLSDNERYTDPIIRHRLGLDK